MIYSDLAVTINISACARLGKAAALIPSSFVKELNGLLAVVFFCLEASLGVSSEICSGYEHSCSEDDKQTWTELYYNMLRERVTGKHEWGRTCMGYPSFGTRNFDVTIT